jgi:nitronate monooxygenase
MEFLKKIKLIQGGMGVYVSNWRLAKAVATEIPGTTAGTVSGTGLDVVYVRLLQLGDPGGQIQRAFTAFDATFGVEIGKKIIEKYYIEGGKTPSDKFRYGPLHTVRAEDGGRDFPISPSQEKPFLLTIDEELIELLIISSFAEVWLAKEGHNGVIFINFLKKIDPPLIYAIYGAMLAQVDGFVVGAGNPDGLPAICANLAQHSPVIYELPVLYREAGETFILSFDPGQLLNGKLTRQPLVRPAFLAIVSMENLVNVLAHSSSQPPDGFIIEHHTAGGHNAAPQGAMSTDDLGQPVYSELDEPNVEVIKGEGFPFWLAGGYGSRNQFNMAITKGAKGIQVGSSFAMAEESGLSNIYRTALFKKIRNGSTDAELVRTSLFSPTGFPFKVVQLNETLSEEDKYASRRRVCDLGMLQQRGLSKPDINGSRRLFQRCPAAPIDDFINKRGLLSNSEGKRCLCNGLLAGVGLGQIVTQYDTISEEPAIITMGNNLEGVRRLSREGHVTYWAKNVIEDILGGE